MLEIDFQLTLISQGHTTQLSRGRHDPICHYLERWSVADEGVNRSWRTTSLLRSFNVTTILERLGSVLLLFLPCFKAENLFRSLTNLAPNLFHLLRHCILSFLPLVPSLHLHNELSTLHFQFDSTAPPHSNEQGRPTTHPRSQLPFPRKPTELSFHSHLKQHLLQGPPPSSTPPKHPLKSQPLAPTSPPNEPPSAPFPFPPTHLTSPPHHKPPTPLPLPTSPSIPPPHKPPSNNYSTSTLSSALTHLHPTTPLPTRSMNCAQDAQISRLEC